MNDPNPAYGLNLYAAAGTEPITTDEAKAQCRIDGNEDDTYIAALIKVARAHVEGWIGRRLVTQTWDYVRDDFPVGSREIMLPYGPVQSISSITYIDAGGTSTTLSSSLYVLDTYSFLARLYPAYTQIWPATRPSRNAVTVRYVTGYGAYTAIPPNITHAIKMLVAHWYESREMIVTGTILAKVPQTVEDLLSMERASWL